MINYSGFPVCNMMVYSMVAQLFNVTFWKCFKLGGMILAFTGFFQWSFVMDHMSESFLIFCTFIGLLVVYYSSYYMFKSEVNLFSSVIILFITSMLMLTSSSNMMTMFIGWEGVGVISFILIGWFMSREKAISASFYAFMFNRFADFFFLILLLWEIGGQHSLFYLQLMKDPSYHNNVTLGVLFIITVSFWMATAGKSAQFAFHPWLTLAMEGPTPVSSLLHSSTMVVAGVYLLLKLHPLIISSHWLELNNVIILSSVVTMVFTSLWAMSQVDIKKIIALSTTSQLSFMMVMCCMGQYDLAFLHMVLHGFFKALLFLGSGITIHNNLTNSQEITKLNLLMKGSTFLHTVFIIGVFGLMGAPFMGSFHSKHLILDVTQSINSLSFHGLHYLSYCSNYISTLAYVGLYFSPVMTLGYSLKLFSFISQKPSMAMISSSYISSSHSDLKVVMPMFLLTTSSFVVGLMISQNMSGGMFTSISLEDIYYSLFFFVLFLGLLYYILLIQNPLSFSYSLSGSVVKFNMLYARDLFMLFLFQLVEYLSLKKGLKKLIPTYNMKNEQGFLLYKYFSLEFCLFTYLFNLAVAILFMIMFFTFLF